MKFKLDYPVIVRLDQIEELKNFRDGDDSIRSRAISAKWHPFEYATINGELQEHHLYFIVSRDRARFAGLEDPRGYHFSYKKNILNSPVAINFDDPSVKPSVMDGTLDLSNPEISGTLLHSFKSQLNISQLTDIFGEPCDQEFVNAARFRFPGRDICVPLSPDLWNAVQFPFRIPTDAPENKYPFDYRIEYIGISVNYVEDRLDSHAHIRRIQTSLASQNPNREAFAIMYQVDFEKPSGEFGHGNRENKLELEAAEAILIQYFKPQYNIRSIKFSLTQRNDAILDENLAQQMIKSGDYPVGKTEVLVKSPAEHDKGFSLNWGRFFTDHKKGLYKINTFYF